MDILKNIKEENEVKKKDINKKEQKLMEMEEIVNSNRNLCKICLEKEVNRLFLPCRHLAVCHECVISLKSCHICRSKITTIVNVSYSPSKNFVRPAPHLSSLRYKE